MVYNFHPQTLDILLSHGWTPERRVDTRGYERLFFLTGQPVSPQILDFLQSFGGLKIGGLSIDPPGAWDYKGEDVYRHYVRFIGRPLCIVAWPGKPTSESAWYMSPSGDVYSAWSNFVHLWGDTVEKSFDNIFVHRKFTVIPLASEG